MLIYVNWWRYRWLGFNVFSLNSLNGLYVSLIKPYINNLTVYAIDTSINFFKAIILIINSPAISLNATINREHQNSNHPNS